jgi:predicted DsbA family dithiol-disulfide isomerase
MKIEVWSDVACPFCYIGKQHLDQALEQFAEQVEVEWHSFQLDPSFQPVPGKSHEDLLSEKKGWSVSQTRQIHEHVTNMGKEAGIEFRFDEVVPANTLLAHQLIQLGRNSGRQHEVEEKLFSAYFRDGKNIGDAETLIEIGTAAGLHEEVVKKAITSNAFTGEIKADQQEANELGVSGVPFFVFDRRFAVSGAQPVSVFQQVLEKVREESKKPKVTMITENQDSCDIDGNC